MKNVSNALIFAMLCIGTVYAAEANDIPMIQQHAPRKIQGECDPGFPFSGPTTPGTYDDCKRLERILFCVYQCNRNPNDWASKTLCRDLDNNTKLPSDSIQYAAIDSFATNSHLNNGETLELLRDFRAALIALQNKALADAKAAEQK